MMDKIKFNNTVEKFLEAKYKQGAFGPRSYDCITFIYCFYRDLGYDPPDAINGYTAENYLKKYEDDPVAAKEIMLAYIRSLGDPVNTASDHARLGDILILHQADGTFAAVVVIGRSIYMGVHAPYGVIVLPKKSVQKDITTEVIRPCHRQSRS